MPRNIGNENLSKINCISLNDFLKYEFLKYFTRHFSFGRKKTRILARINFCERSEIKGFMLKNTFKVNGAL